MSNFPTHLQDPGMGSSGRAPPPMGVGNIEPYQSSYQSSFTPGQPTSNVSPQYHGQQNFPPPTQPGFSCPTQIQNPNQTTVIRDQVNNPPYPPAAGFHVNHNPASVGPNPVVENVTKQMGNIKISFITSAITSQLSNRLQERDKFTAVFIPEGKPNSIPWKTSPTEFHWEWNNSSYVKLPLSSLYRKNKIDNGKTVSVPRWQIVEEKLVGLKKSCEHGGNIPSQLKECVNAYNAKLSADCNFKILYDRELSNQLIRVLPVIIDYCLELPYRLEKPIPFLKKGTWHTIFMTRGLCASLLANAFLSTFPHHNVRDPKQFPHFHFLKLFHEGPEGASRAKAKVEKIKCILEYFEQMKTAKKEEKDLVISFERRYIPSTLNWENSRHQLSSVTVNNTETIEDAKGLLQADFANKYVGGGVLGDGMVQEEIRFAICPELIVSRLFTEVLGDDEVLVVTGAKQFSSYSGYSSSFEFKRMPTKGRSLEKDEFGREMVQVVAMDALNFKPGSELTQYQKRNIDRELHKCVVAFYPGGGNLHKNVATGNWGCGAFNGDAQLKFVIQWMAASEAVDRCVTFYTMGNRQQEDEIKKFERKLSQKRITVGQLYKILGKYEMHGNLHTKKRTLVFDFITRQL